MQPTTLRFPRFPHSLVARRHGSTAARAKSRSLSLRTRPVFDSLEGRQLLSGVFTVSNTNDSGPGSLRAAILASNASPVVSPTPTTPVADPAPVNASSGGGGSSSGSSGLGSASLTGPTAAAAPFNLIEFSLPAGSTISPLSALPAITQPVETFAPINFTSAGPTVPTITINGSQAGAGTVGFDIQSHGTILTDLAIDDFSGGGVLLDGAGATGNAIESDYIGVGLTGTGAAGNGTFGVEARGGASSNQIDDDVISANSGNGVVLTGSGTSNNVVQLDQIGTNPTGSYALGNGGSGVVINLSASSNTVTNDLISGNGYNGVYITDPGTSGNVVAASEIGTNAAGSAALPNGSVGVYILNSATNNTVGSGDVISGNAGDGVAIAGSGTSQNVVTGDFIGTNAAGTAGLGVQYTGVYILNSATSNTIGGTTAGARNVISGNVYNGVYITGSGTQYNDVEGDYIGTDVTGNHAVGNQSGVVLAGGASDNFIGTTQPGAGNVISGNSYGVEITDSGTTLNWVENDLIGTNAGDTYAVANSIGVTITAGASYNGIYSNVISGNFIGVEILQPGTTNNYLYFNEIGTNQSGTIAIGNSFCGVYDYQASNNVIIYNTIEFNGCYGLVNSSATNTYYYNTVIDNGYMNMLTF
jgi:hypothetical protein